jgi:hypothetical protein
MYELLKNPLFYILIVNIIILGWNILSWKRGIREKWMNNVRDAGAEVIGAAELVYAESSQNSNSLKPETMSSFIAKEQKLLLLFAHNEAEKNDFEVKSENLRCAAESTNVSKYRQELKNFSKSINDRVLKEWRGIK